MKKNITILLIAQTFFIQAQSNYHQSFTQPNHTISEVVYANEFNTSSFVVSNYFGINAYESFGMITKFTTTTGAITSSKAFSFTGNDIIIKGANKKNQALYMIARIDNPNPSASGTLVYKYNLSSNTITWRKLLNNSPDYSVQSITTDSSKYLYILGSVYNPNTSGSDLAITKMDTIGNLLWTKSFGSDDLDEYPSTILFKGNREIYISTVNFTGPFGRPTIIRLDSAGNIINTTCIATLSSPRFGSTQATLLNNKLVVVNNTIVGPGDQGPVLIQTFDSNLVSLNSAIIGGLKVSAISSSPSNKLLLSGAAPVSNGQIGERVIRMDTNLTTVASRHFHKMTSFSIASSNASFINAANQSIHAFIPGGNDSLFIIKADMNESTGCRDSVFVPATETFSYIASTYTYALLPIITTTASITIPVTSYTLNSASLCTGITTKINDNVINNDEILIYPNPTIGNFSVLSNNADVNFITITDALGREILAQYNMVNIDVSNLQRGIYFVIIYDKKGNVSSVKKMYII